MEGTSGDKLVCFLGGNGEVLVRGDWKEGQVDWVEFGANRRGDCVVVITFLGHLYERQFFVIENVLQIWWF